MLLDLVDVRTARAGKWWTTLGDGNPVRAGAAEEGGIGIGVGGGTAGVET